MDSGEDIDTRILDEEDIRKAMGKKQYEEVLSFVYRSVQENIAFRQKVLIWLINTCPESFPQDKVLNELNNWIDEVFNKWVEGKPPKLSNLSPVKSAVINAPDLAVPIYLRMLEGVISILDGWPDGPQSYHMAAYSYTKQVTLFLSKIADTELRQEYMARLEYLADRGEMLGYGVSDGIWSLIHDARKADRVAVKASPHSKGHKNA